MADTFAVSVHFLGVTYAAGAALPTLSTAVRNHLLARGVILPSGALVRRPFTANGVSYAVGAAVPGAVTGAALRRLIRGRYIG